MPQSANPLIPHLPDQQEKIRAAHSFMASKHIAYEQIENTRPDWDEVKIHAMAYVLTQKLRSVDFSQKLEGIGTLPIVELSMRDDFWGAC